MGWFKKKKKILIVEDEADIADNIKNRLVLENYKVAVANDGKVAVEQARASKPDLIVLDVMMPVIDGFEACQILKHDDRTKNIPILIVTALPHIGDVENAMNNGADDFLNKPFTNDKLVEKVRNLLK